MRQSTNILIFHRILSEKSAIDESPSYNTFGAKINIIKKFTHNCSPLPRCLEKSQSSLLKRALAVTFDDGYFDNFEVALPILKRHGVSATFFIASGYLNGGWMWNDGIIEAVTKIRASFLDLTALDYEKYSLETDVAKKKCISDLIGRIKYLDPAKRTDLARRILDIADVPEPTHLMMTDEQVKQMHEAGMEIGGHTVNHPILTSVDKATSRREINENKEYLENLIGEPLHSFAYPNGKPGKDYGPEHIALVKEAGYQCAVSTAWGRVNKNSDPFQLPRFTPWDKHPLKFLLRLIFHRYKEV